MSSSMRGAGGARLLAGVVALGLSLAFGGAAHAAPQYTMDCTSCHTMPPADSGTAKKDPFTGAVPGNHQGHATDQQSSCVVCHGSAVTNPGYTNSHRNKVIELSDGLGYTRKVNGFLNQTSVPPNPLGTCSTAACHSDGKGNLTATPAWGRAAFQAPGDCSQCHLVAPYSGNHPVTGSKHGNYFGTGTGSCQKCHADHTAAAKPFSHATSAGKRSVDVHFAAGGSFASGQCSNVYCHSNGKSVYTPVTWGTTLDCSGCHGTATSTGPTALSVKHGKHVNNPAFLGTNYGCVECHSDTVSNNSTIANTAKHTNGGPIDVVGANAGTFTAASGTCATSYCHSDGKGTQKSVTWTQSQTLDCKGCHGSDTTTGFFTGVAGEPNYKNDGMGQPRANSHKNHVASATDCQNCHANTTTDGVSIKSGAAHISHTAEVVAGNGKSFTAVGDTCSNVSCHSGNGIIANVGAARWGQSLGCSGCHGDSSTLATNAHAKHITDMGYSCSTCHVSTVASGSTTITGSALHGNGTVNVAGTLTFTSADKSCATACHMSSAPKWNVASSGGCGTCHAALSTTTNGIITKDAHDVHYQSAYGPKLDGTTANVCASCHVYTGDTGATHANGTINLAAGYSANGKCSTCHQLTTNWTATGRLSCESCHTGTLSVINVSGVNKTAADKGLSASYGHGGLGEGCVNCHDSNSAHIGVAGGTKRLIGGVTGNAACATCHVDGGSAPAKQSHVGSANTCVACHDPHGTLNATMVRTSLNGTTVAFGGFDYVNAQGTGVCQACHTATAYYMKGVAENNHPATNCLECHAHNTASGTAFEPNRACDSCHGYPPAPRRTATAVTFGVQGSWSSARFEDYSGGGGAHVLAAHIAKDAKPSDGWVNCVPCHQGGAASHNKAMPMRDHVENVTVKLDQSLRFSNDAFAIYTSQKLVSGGVNKSGSCFNVSCHFKKTRPWSMER